MKSNIFLVLTILFFSCNNQNKSADILQKENQLLKKESELEKREKEISNKETSDPKPNPKLKTEKHFDPNSNVRGNLIHCENEKYTIRIDRMANDDLRYTSWNKPKTESDNPDLILNNPEVEKQGSGGGYIYAFKKGEWSYIIEDNRMGESDEMIGKFLKLLQNDNLISYTKLQDVK